MGSHLTNDKSPERKLEAPHLTPPPPPLLPHPVPGVHLRNASLAVKYFYIFKVRRTSLPGSYSAPGNSSSLLRVFISLLTSFICPTGTDAYLRNKTNNMKYTSSRNDLWIHNYFSQQRKKEKHYILYLRRSAVKQHRRLRTKDEFSCFPVMANMTL